MTEAETTETDQKSPRFTHAAAAAAVWGFGFLILRIFAVSGYDWHTAFLVSTTLRLDDGVALVFGSLMAGHLLTAFALMIVLPLLIVASVWGQRAYRPFLLLLAALCLVLLVALTISFRSWWLPPSTAAVLGVLVLAHRLPKKHRLRHAVGSAIARAGGLTGLATLMVAALVQTPWVPHEQISTSNGTVTGYVLSVDPGYLNVLTDQGEFVILVSSDVLYRR